MARRRRGDLYAHQAQFTQGDKGEVQMSFFRYPERKFDPCPAGMHPAVCVDVVDMGDVAGQYGIKPKVRLVFQIAEVDAATGRRFDVAAFYTNSMHKKAKLRIDLSSWAGRPL